MDPVNGLDPRTQAVLDRAGLGRAANSLTLGEIEALRRNYSSDDAASTVSIDLEEVTSPPGVPAASTTVYTIFGFFDPIVVSEIVPDTNLEIANPFDRVEQMLKDRRDKVSTFSHLMAQVHAMDLFDMSSLGSTITSKAVCLLCVHLLDQFRDLAEKILMYQTHFMTGNQVANLCQLLESFSTSRS